MNTQNPKCSIIMPVYNQEVFVGESIFSALSQDYKDKEIVVIDDYSIDNTFRVCKSYSKNIKIYRNRENLGLAKNLNECIKKSRGEYIIILCGDDIFTHRSVISDMIRLFDDNPKLGVIGRYYYQYLEGNNMKREAVMAIRGNIFPSSCQPSGIGFRRSAMQGEFEHKIFVEIPLMVRKIVDAGWEWEMIKYDTIAARLHLGKNPNAAANPSYYKTTPQQSPTLNWYAVLGEPIEMYMGFIQIKNRASWMLLSEIKETIKLNPKCLFNLGFWFCVLVALMVPGWILRRLSNFYRNRITKRFVKPIKREDTIINNFPKIPYF